MDRERNLRPSLRCKSAAPVIEHLAAPSSPHSIRAVSTMRCAMPSIQS
jgi:hypothetical protein